MSTLPETLGSAALANSDEPPATRADAQIDENVRRDSAALAKGGRTNFFGFLLRLGARMPFFFVAGRFYGAERVGRWAYALVIVELVAQLATLGQKRGIAQRLAQEDRYDANIVADAMLLSLMIGAVAAVGLWLFPGPMFPSGDFTLVDRLLPFTILPATVTDIALASLAYRYDVAATVRSRSVVEPWSLSITAGLCWFLAPGEGLSVAYIVSIFASAVVALWPWWKSYGLPRGWRPHPAYIGRLALNNMPLAVADAVEWGTRKVDIAILGQFASPSSVGVYYIAQQVATLPQKLKTSFEPILGPVITRNLKQGNLPAIARQVCQVGFWITAAQAGIALALGIPGGGVLALVGPHFVGGFLALAFLLAAEVTAAPAVVSEAALIYIAPMRNLYFSIATIGLQAALTLAGMEIDRAFGLDEMAQAASAAGALAVTLTVASLAKSLLLSRLIDQRISNLRWPLFAAGAVAALVGWLAITWLPEWAQVALGIPAILGAYCWVIWVFGFGEDDRVLFRREKEAPAAGAPRPA